MIQVDRFCKNYNGFNAVTDLSFTVEPGQILGLIGPNGAGKTTVMRALSGIVPPTSGRLAIAGHDIQQEPLKAKKALAYIPDEPRLFDNLTVWEHLEFFAAAYQVKEHRTEAGALLEFFNLAEKRHHVVQSLSLGMRQKVAIACAYLHHPQVLLFDEPLTGLDPAGIRAIQDSMRERAEQGACIIISSHLLSLVETLCSHLLVLHQGQSQRFGSMGTVLQSFDQARHGSTLEDVFFSITRGDSREQDLRQS